MKGALYVTALLVAAFSSAAAAGETPTELVVERYDVILITHDLATAQRNWEVHRVHFIRNGRVIADRILTEDMLWSLEGASFVLFWNDYGNCHRLIRAQTLRERTIVWTEEETNEAEAVPWWGMGRRMTDLQAPQEE